MLLHIIGQDSFKTIQEVWANLGATGAWLMSDASSPLMPSISTGQLSIGGAGTPTYNQAITGFAYNGIEFDPIVSIGGDSNVDTAADLSVTQEISFCILIETGSSVSGEQYIVVGDYSGARGYMLRIDTGKLYIEASGVTLFDTGLTVTADTVYKIGYTQSQADSEINLYVNDEVYNGTHSLTTFSNPINSLVVGAQNTAGNNDFEGKMALLSFYQEKLTAGEIASLFDKIDQGG